MNKHLERLPASDYNMLIMAGGTFRKMYNFGRLVNAEVSSCVITCAVAGYAWMLSIFFYWALHVAPIIY